MTKKNPTKYGHNIEDLIQEGCKILASQEKPCYIQVCQELKAHYGCVIPYFTLWNWYLGKSLPPKKAHVQQQLLSPEAEKVLVDWIIYLSDTAHPLSKRTIQKKAEVLCGKKPSQSWIRWFLRRWPGIQLGKPSGLDPKRAQAFNRPVAKRHFDLLLEIIQKHGIPVENIYNMDEKGCQ